MASHATDRRTLPPRPGEVEQQAPDERAPAAPALLGLPQAIGNQAFGRVVARHRVAPTPVDRLTKLELLGDGTAANPGATLDEFEASSRTQADWFQEPTLDAADRAKLWAVLRRVTGAPHVTAGAGDLRMADLVNLTDADWTGLTAFGRACHAGSNTIRIADATAYTLRSRIDTGATLLALEATIPPEVLELTVSELQLREVHAAGLVPQIAAYRAAFSPHLQQQFEPGPTARGPEFQGMLDMIALGGHTRYNALLGRVRNLHRFPDGMLQQLLRNFADTSRRRPADLVLHTGHDESAFMESAFLFSDLVVNSPHNVLFLEGQASLAAITAEIPNLAATYGQLGRDGVARFAQTMIAGHGEARVTELAGTGNERVEDGQVHYDSESLDLDGNQQATIDLLDALMSNMDPATARLVFAGCLVGSNNIPAGTPAAGVAGHIAANPSLGPFAEAMGRRMGMPAGFTQSARASVGLSGSTSMMDASGRFEITYPFDPAAFADNLTYIATGHEPEGVMRAVVEVISTSGGVVAETQLRARLTAAPTTDPWWDEMTLAAVRVALDGVANGAGVTHDRMLALSHMVGVPFLARWAGSYGREASTYVSEVNTQAALAPLLYREVAATGTWNAPPDLKARGGRLIGEQGWMMLPAAREAALIAWLDGEATFTAEQIETHLDPGVILPKAATLFGAAPSSGRIRLALAWLKKQPGTADVRTFLDNEVQDPGTGPQLSPAVRAELGNIEESEVLRTLGRLLPMAGGAPGAPALPEANAAVLGQGTNRVLIEPQPYEATVIPFAANVRSLPGMHGQVRDTRPRGAAVNVMGFVHDWAAVDDDGHIGFIYRNLLTPP